MAIPTYDRFIEPLLRFLASCPGEVAAAQAHAAAADVLGVSEADRQERLPSGLQPVYKNRVGWAHDRLKRAGLSHSPRRGYWELTDEGRRYAGLHPAPLPSDAIERLSLGYLDVRLRPGTGGDGALPLPNAEAAVATAATLHKGGPVAGTALATASPDERLTQALMERRRSVAAEVLEALGGVSPSFFESIVLDLLHRMGYGGRREDLQRVGGSGDGGIDGIISLDRLGLEKVYVQAKRWKPVVGRPEVQAFYGALAGQRAHKGVFITTSSYTAQALEFARSVERIVLVDGVRLAELMIDHEVGVTSRVLKVPRLDSDYFDEDAG